MTKASNILDKIEKSSLPEDKSPKLKPREAAQQGYYLVNSKYPAKVGSEVDWYLKDGGDKFSGKVTAMKDGSITITDGDGKKHAYKMRQEN